MADQPSEPESGPSARTENTAADAAPGADGYLGHVRSVLTEPDRFFDSGHRSGRREAMTDVAIFLLLYFLASVIARSFGFSGFQFELEHLGHGFKSVLVLALPLAGLVFAWSWQGARAGGQDEPGFYIEKLGGALLLPALLLVFAIVLEFIGARIESWFRGAAMASVYVAVFALSRAYAAPGSLKIAVGLTLGFYFAYRLLVMLF